jgi:hypothetical protein
METVVWTKLPDVIKHIAILYAKEVVWGILPFESLAINALDKGYTIVQKRNGLFFTGADGTYFIHGMAKAKGASAPTSYSPDNTPLFNGFAIVYTDQRVSAVQNGVSPKKVESCIVARDFFSKHDHLLMRTDNFYGQGEVADFLMRHICMSQFGIDIPDKSEILQMAREALFVHVHAEAFSLMLMKARMKTGYISTLALRIQDKLGKLSLQRTKILERLDYYMHDGKTCIDMGEQVYRTFYMYHTLSASDPNESIPTPSVSYNSWSGSPAIGCPCDFCLSKPSWSYHPFSRKYAYVASIFMQLIKTIPISEREHFTHSAGGNPVVFLNAAEQALHQGLGEGLLPQFLWHVMPNKRRIRVNIRSPGWNQACQSLKVEISHDKAHRFQTQKEVSDYNARTFDIQVRPKDPIEPEYPLPSLPNWVSVMPRAQRTRGLTLPTRLNSDGIHAYTLTQKFAMSLPYEYTVAQNTACDALTQLQGKPPIIQWLDT